MKSDNLRPISETTRPIVQQVAEAAIKAARERGDHEQADRWQRLYNQTLVDEWPF